MKKHIYKFTLSVFIILLFLFSSCTGFKPFFEISNSPQISPLYNKQGSSNITPPATYGLSEKYSFHPSFRIFNDESASILNFKKKQWKVSLSFPASLKFEFDNAPL